MVSSEEFQTTDVLVVGAGFAGCFAAIRARELGVEVVMVEQGKSGFAGSSAWGTHMTRVVLPDDDLDNALEGTVLESDYMVDQEYAEGALIETWERLQEFLKLGADFRRDDSGQIRWYFKSTLYPHVKQRCALWEPMGSYKHLMKVKGEAVRQGVKIFDRVVITELLTSEGKVVGAVGFNKRKGDFYVFKAKAVVIATGSSAAAGAGSNPSLTGDGVAMGLRAGAELRGMEFGKVGIAGTMSPVPGGPHWVYCFVGPEEKEITITNVKGEEFVEKYESIRSIPGRRYYGPPWKIHVQAMLKECREGRGPCYVDYRAPDKSNRMREFLGSFYDQNVALMRLSGSTLDRIKYELGIGRGSDQNGGIRINPHGVSTVPGLFAGGIASDMCCAPHYSIPANIMGSHITGRRAGESAAKYAKVQSEPSVNAEYIESLKKAIYAPLHRKKGTTEEEIRIKLIKAWLNIDIRNETRLTKACQDLQELEQEASTLTADDYHELANCHKIRNQTQVAQAVAGAALARRETRQEHVREDYPLMDNKDWLKWVIVRRVGDQTQTHVENIPIERWKFKPEPTLVDRLQLRKESNHD